nr:DegV family protein [Dehalococcoides mccartyi]
MNIKIVTDSTADIPPQLAKSLGITIVPLYVRFGEKALKDGVEITQDQFFERLQTESVHPNTSQPSPQDFIDVYRELAPTCDGIVSIHISSKLSGTYDSAIQAKKLLGKDAPPDRSYRFTFGFHGTGTAGATGGGSGFLRQKS